MVGEKSGLSGDSGVSESVDVLFVDVREGGRQIIASAVHRVEFRLEVGPWNRFRGLDICNENIGRTCLVRYQGHPS